MVTNYGGTHPPMDPSCVKTCKQLHIFHTSPLPHAQHFCNMFATQGSGVQKVARVANFYEGVVTLREDGSEGQPASSKLYKLVDYGQLPWGKGGDLPRDPFLRKMCDSLELRQVGNCCAVNALLVALLEEGVFTEAQLLALLAPTSPPAAAPAAPSSAATLDLDIQQPAPASIAARAPAPSTLSTPAVQQVAPTSPPTVAPAPSAAVTLPVEQPAEPDIVPGKQLAHIYRGDGEVVVHQLTNKEGMKANVSVTHWGLVTPRSREGVASQQLSQKELQEVTVSVFAF